MNYERLGRNCRFWKEAKGNLFFCWKHGAEVICPPGPVPYKCWEKKRNGPKPPKRAINGVEIR